MNNLVTTLEQSKLLEEWGAPQKDLFYWMKMQDPTIYGDSPEKAYTLVINDEDLTSENKFNSDTDFSAYTLGELIDWLGYDFRNLEKVGKNWIALSNFLNGQNNVFRSFGKTSLEAVFNLCRAVHEKGDKC